MTNGIDRCMGKRVIDIDLIVTAILFYLTIPLIIYIAVSNLSRIPLISIPLVFIVLILSYVAFRSVHRFASYEVHTDSIEMRNGTMLFSKVLTIKRKDVRDVFEVDPYKWSWMKGSNDKLPIFFLFKDGRKWVEIKNPPRELTTAISDGWGIKIERSSKAGFLQKHIENEARSGSN